VEREGNIKEGVDEKEIIRIKLKSGYCPGIQKRIDSLLIALRPIASDGVVIFAKGKVEAVRKGARHKGGGGIIQTRRDGSDRLNRAEKGSRSKVFIPDEEKGWRKRPRILT